MVKEYMTVQEIAGPLLLVEDVDGRQVRGTGRGRAARRGRSGAAGCSRSNEDTALVQLFEGTTGRRRRQREGALPRAGASSSGSRPTCSAGSSTGSGGRSTTGPRSSPREKRDINGNPHQPHRPRLPHRVHPDRHLVHRRAEHAGARAEAADLLAASACRTPSWPRRSPARRRCWERRSDFAVVFARDGHHLRGGGLLHRRLPDARAPSSGRSCSSTWPTTRPSSASRRRGWR